MIAPSRESLVGVRALDFPSNQWLNRPPLDLKQGTGRNQYTLLHFWSLSSPESLETLPTLQLWRDRYGNRLEVVGVHAPEFAFERAHDVVRRALIRHAVSWPTLHDQDHAFTDRYHNHYWPRFILINPQGRIIHDEIGGHNLTDLQARLDGIIRPRNSASTSSLHTHRHGNLCYPGTNEMLLGYERGTYKNQPIERHTKRTFQHSGRLEQPGVALSGEWEIRADAVESGAPNESTHLSFTFSAASASLVAGKTRHPVAVRLLLNEQPIPKRWRGDDLEYHGSESVVRITEARLYHLFHATNFLGAVELRLQPLQPGFTAHALHVRGCTANVDAR